MSEPETPELATERIAGAIFLARGTKVLLDSDLARLYGVSTKRFNEQVHRNRDRFPADFMFHLQNHELNHLRSQIATSSGAHGGRRYMPYAFTEHGAIMAAMVLNSSRAIEMSIHVVRAFVKLRQVLASNDELAWQLNDLELRLKRRCETYDQAIAGIFRTLNELMNPPQTYAIGFTADFSKKP